MENNFDISKLQKQVKETLFHLPRLMGVKAVEVFKENFRLKNCTIILTGIVGTRKEYISPIIC